MTTPRGSLDQAGHGGFLWIRCSLIMLCSLCAIAGLSAEPAAKRSYDVPESDATVSLRLFAEQSGLEIIYPAEDVKGVKTNALKGKFAAREAIDRLIAGTPLTITSAKSGALAINRTRDAKPQGKPPRKTTRLEPSGRHRGA